MLPPTPRHSLQLTCNTRSIGLINLANCHRRPVQLADVVVGPTTGIFEYKREFGKVGFKKQPNYQRHFDFVSKFVKMAATIASMMAQHNVTVI